MGFSSSTRGQKIVILLNTLLRFVQLCIAASIISIYAKEKSFWLDHGLPSKIAFELSIGVISLLTAIAFALIPLLISYRPIAIAAPWDFFIFILYIVAFALMKSLFWDNVESASFRTITKDFKQYDHHRTAMIKDFWVNLGGMFVFLLSGIMGMVLLWEGKRSSSGTKPSLV